MRTLRMLILISFWILAVGMIFTGIFGDSDGECLPIPSSLGDACIDWKFTLIILGVIFLLFTRKVLNWIFGIEDEKEEEQKEGVSSMRFIIILLLLVIILLLLLLVLLGFSPLLLFLV